MVEILRVEGATRVLGRSQGYYGLPVRDDVVEEVFDGVLIQTRTDDSVTGPGTPRMTTAWQLSEDEILALAAGAPLYLHVVGTGHPPVMLSVGDPADPEAHRSAAENLRNHRAG